MIPNKRDFVLHQSQIVSLQLGWSDWPVTCKTVLGHLSGNCKISADHWWLIVLMHSSVAGLWSALGRKELLAVNVTR